MEKKISITTDSNRKDRRRIKGYKILGDVRTTIVEYPKHGRKIMRKRGMKKNSEIYG